MTKCQKKLLLYIYAYHVHFIELLVRNISSYLVFLSAKIASHHFAISFMESVL